MEQELKDSKGMNGPCGGGLPTQSNRKCQQSSMEDYLLRANRISIQREPLLDTVRVERYTQRYNSVQEDYYLKSVEQWHWHEADGNWEVRWNKYPGFLIKEELERRARDAKVTDSSYIMVSIKQDINVAEHASRSSLFNTPRKQGEQSATPFQEVS